MDLPLLIPIETKKYTNQNIIAPQNTIREGTKILRPRERILLADIQPDGKQC
jgi:hypothetical protein